MKHREHGDVGADAMRQGRRPSRNKSRWVVRAIANVVQAQGIGIVERIIDNIGVTIH